MSESDETDLIGYLGGGRQLLQTASQVYERPLSPEEYWWMGVGLAASTLAELSGKPYAVSRLEQLLDRLGYKGLRGDWLQRFVEELAELNAEGLIWPVYQRSPEGPMEPTGLEVNSRFDGEAAYFLALGHIGVALALNREQSEIVQQLSGAIAALVEHGPAPEQEAVILGALRPLGGDGN